MLPTLAIYVTALTIFVVLLVWAAISDFRRFLIPNQVSLGLLALYPVYLLSAPVPQPWIFALIMAAIFFAVGFGMYLARAMGAGDAKLLPIVVLWVGPAHFTLFLLILLGSAFVLAGVVGWRTAAAKARSEREAPEGVPGAGAVAADSAWARLLHTAGWLRHVPFLKIQVPYGVAIAAGGIGVALNILFTTLR